MHKSILTVGFQLACDDTENADFSSKKSLLDWDIILFKPTIEAYTDYCSNVYLGKPSLSERESFSLKESCEHWRREIKQAFESGKTVIIFLPDLEEVYVDTGLRDYSGTGRNTLKTIRVELSSNYKTIPVPLKLVSSSGRAMKLVGPDAELLRHFWTEFGAVSEYKVILGTETKGICITTKSGDKPVGTVIRSEASNGVLVMLPDIDFFPDSFVEADGEGKDVWTDEGVNFGNRMVNAIVALDKAVKSSSITTPEPHWATDSAFFMPSEMRLKVSLLEVERKLREENARIESLKEELRLAGRFRALLYEKGKPLEHAIVESLSILGFSAKPFKDRHSEFDVVFESAEGRFLGEAEGKDNKPINIDKLRQLAMNIHEDLEREEVSVPAKGVLFGNAYRMIPPAKRPIQFTDKCLTSVTSSGTALVNTSDLFAAIQYVIGHQDFDYARRCREEILKAIGIVVFPPHPQDKNTDAVELK